MLYTDILLASGQAYILDQMAGSYYVGLLTNNNAFIESDQIGATLVETSGYSGYVRQGTTLSRNDESEYDPRLTGTQVTFTVSGEWPDVNGYFVSETISGPALWCGLLPAEYRGDKSDTTGDVIKFTPNYSQLYKGEE